MKERPRAKKPPREVEADIGATLRERIAGHTIPPGAKLTEAELAAEFGVSRTRVREALTGLELRGLIRREPNRGAVVTRLVLAEIFAIYEVREALEGMAARLAAQNSPAGAWQYWVDQFKPRGPLHDHVEAGDVELYFNQYDRLRTEIVRVANNPVLAGMLDGILEKTRMIMRRVQILPGRAKQSLGEHRAVVGALNAGNADEAERLRRENIRSAVATLRRFQYFVV